MNIYTKHVLETIVAQVDLEIWPEVEDIFSGNEEIAPLDWRLPIYSYQAVSKTQFDFIPIAAAIACLRESIILVDDLLDEDPKGHHIQMGWGRAANLAIVLYSVGQLFLQECGVSPENQNEAITTLNRMMLDTANGQELDVQNLTGEENYWQVVEAKSTPFYGACLQVGAQLAGATADVAKDIYALGKILGEIVQIHDDLEDAFQNPANPDWEHGRNNLALLYGLTADHPQQKRFAELRNQVDEADALHEAQQILIECGAVSYCLYHLFQRHQTANQILAELPLAAPAHIATVFSMEQQLLVTFFETNKIPIDGINFHHEILA